MAVTVAGDLRGPFSSGHYLDNVIVYAHAS